MIQRYEVKDMNYNSGMIILPSITGIYVKYEDHKAEVEDLKTEITLLKTELDNARERAVNTFARGYGRSKY